jgi:hypothetical protein
MDEDFGIKCERCPLCSGPPSFAWVEITPWFCPNEECNVLGWDPYSTLEENLMDAGHVRVFINGIEQPPADS